jgi:hypothetical protein
MKFIKGLLIFFGILFLIEIILLVSIYFWNPLNLWGHDDISDINNTEKYDHPLLNESQEETLEKLNIDVQYIPERITPVMQECFLKTLGQERVDEIIAGDSPSPVDLFKAKECISE